MKLRNFFPNKGYDLFCLALYLFLLTYALLGLGYHISIMNGESVRDSLYNFAGGFIRRGLGGEILFFIQDRLHIPMARTLYLISAAAYFFLVWIVTRAFLKKGYGWNVLIMSFALGGVLIYGFDASRRDFVELALFALVLLAYRRMPFKWWVVPANVLIMLGIALHEATFFFTVPILILISNRRVDNIVKSVCLWLPSVLTFLLCCVFKGTPEAFGPIAERAMQYAPQCFPGGEMPDLLTYVGKNAGDVFQMHIRYNFSGVKYLGSIPVPAYVLTLFYFVYIPYITVAMLISFTPGGLQASVRDRLLRIIVFQFVCLVPMFTVLSCDIGRVATYWILSSLLVWLFAGDRDSERLLSRAGRGVDALSDRIFSHYVPGRFLLMVLMLTVGVVYFSREPSAVFTSSLGGRVVFVIEKYMDVISSHLL